LDPSAVGRLQDLVLAKIDHLLTHLGSDRERFPFLVEDGVWQCVSASDWESSAGNWTAGFWPGLLWSAYSWSQDRRFAEAAFEYCEALAPRRRYPFHDLGFLFEPSCGLGHQLTGSSQLRQWALEAAERLADLYQWSPGILALRPPEEGQFHAAVDTMMNLPLLIRAYHDSRWPRFREVVTGHARTTSRLFIRRDGSTFHIARFRRAPGAAGQPARASDVPLLHGACRQSQAAEEASLEWRGTWQGRSDDSCWSRGQSWAIGGFAQAASLLDDTEVDSILARLLEFWTSRAGFGEVPRWDFSETADGPLDTSAGAIAACGLLECRPAGSIDHRFGRRLLERLVVRHLVAGDAAPGILGGGCFHVRRGLGISTPLIWGDYYLVRALDAWIRTAQPQHP